MQTKRICLWSGPRNVSTALMYAFAQRSDTHVIDEPLYAHYLYNTDRATAHPGTRRGHGVYRQQTLNKSSGR